MNPDALSRLAAGPTHLARMAEPGSRPPAEPAPGGPWPNGSVTHDQRVSPPAALGLELSVKTDPPLVASGIHRPKTHVHDAGRERPGGEHLALALGLERFVKSVPLPVYEKDRTTGGVACREHFH